MGPAPRLASPFDFCVPSARTGLPPDVKFAYRLVTANINFQSTAATAIPSVILHLYSSHYLIYRNLVKSHCLLGGEKAIKSGQIGKLCIMSDSPSSLTDVSPRLERRLYLHAILAISPTN